MSQVDSKQTKDEGEPPANDNEPRPAESDSSTFVQTLWFTIPYVVVAKIVLIWLPIYPAIGIGCFFGGLVFFRSGAHGFAVTVSANGRGSARYCLQPFLCWY